MDTSQNEKGWGYFVQFWKYFFILCFVIIIGLAIVAL